MAKAAATAAAGVAKEIKGQVRLLVLSGEAKPGPAIGQSLGPLGLNMAEFCKQFNATTSKMKPGIPVPVRLTAFKDRTFQFTTQTPPTAWFLKKCANIEKGSSRPVLEVVGKVTLKQVYEIASIKKTDMHLNHIPLEHLCRSVVGSARSMGLEVITGRERAKAATAASTTAAAATQATTAPAAAAAMKDAAKSAPAKASEGAKPAADAKGKAVDDKKKAK